MAIDGEANDIDTLVDTSFARENNQRITDAAQKNALRPGASRDDNDVTFISEIFESEPDVEEFISSHNIDPDKYIDTDYRVNAWHVTLKDASGEPVRKTNWQILVKYQPKLHLQIELKGYDKGIWQPPEPRPAKLAGKPRLILITSDPQIPFHDRHLHELTLRFARDNQVDEWGEIGDSFDLDQLSKHRRKPEWTATPQETVDIGSKVFGERTDALPPYADKWTIWGNHDVRMRNWVLDNAEALFGLKRSFRGVQQALPVLDMAYLTHLPEMGWRHITSPHGEYPYEEKVIAPGLLAIHGTRAKRHAGQSVIQELINRYGCSVLQGHANSLSIIHLARNDAKGNPNIVVGAECGMLGKVAGGMGFSPTDRNWQQGFVTVTVFPNGQFHVELVPYIKGAILWRGNTWSWTPPTKRAGSKPVEGTNG